MLFTQATFIHTFIGMAPGKYRVHSAFEHAINLELPGRHELFSIVTAQKPLVPQGLKLDATLLPYVSQGEIAHFDGTRFCMHDLVIDLSYARLMDLHIAPLTLKKETMETDLSPMKVWFDVERESLSPGVSEFNDHEWQSHLAKRLAKEGFTSVVKSLLGRGPGLTPSGDDFLCGWLWLWTRVRHPGREHLSAVIEKYYQATTSISENFLRLMGAGYALEALKIAENSFQQGFAYMRKQGASSGQDTLCGIDFALRLL